MLNECIPPIVLDASWVVTNQSSHIPLARPRKPWHPWRKPSQRDCPFPEGRRCSLHFQAQRRVPWTWLFGELCWMSFKVPLGILPNLDRKMVQRKQRKTFLDGFLGFVKIRFSDWIPHTSENNMHGNSKACYFDRTFSPIWLDFVGFCCYLIGWSWLVCVFVFLLGGMEAYSVAYSDIPAGWFHWGVG